MQHNIYCANNEYLLTQVEKESVELIVTSPPYWCIKDYCHEEQHGYNTNLYVYLDKLEQAIDDCTQVLKPGCRMAINIGDMYLSKKVFGEYEVLPIMVDIISRKPSELTYMGSIIWHKISNTNPSGGGTWMGSTYYPGDGHITYEHEYILLFRKKGERAKPKDVQVKEASKLSKEERSSYFRGFWDFAPVRQKGHCAMFPIELPRRLIKMYTYVGETVLDPYWGSGTTTKAAIELDRNSIGYEINSDFIELFKATDYAQAENIIYHN